MRKSEVKAALRAAGALAREAEFYLIGTQAVHAYSARPPAEVLLSQECDLYPKNRPETASLLDLELGRTSRFARQHGFYIDVVTPEIATLPTGWESRLQPIRSGRITAWCTEVHDLIVSKLAAGRLKDLEFVGAIATLPFVKRPVLQRRIKQLHQPGDRARVRARLKAVLEELSRARTPIS